MSESKQAMKTMANCNPVEFLRQSNKIRHAADDLLRKSGVKEIRKCFPALKGDETDAEKKRLLREQARKNMDSILDMLMDTHAEETADLLGMMCFLEPGEIKNVSMSEFYKPAMELLNSQLVIDFLLQLMKSEQKSTDA